MLYRMETLSRSQILQDLRLRCHTLAANDNRGFKQEFGVNTWSRNEDLFSKFAQRSSRVHVYGSVQELSEVGKDLPTRAGESEANREKNRYQFILPCECKASLIKTDCSRYVKQCFRCLFVSDCRWSLSGEAVSPKPESTLWLHQCKFRASKFFFGLFMVLLPPFILPEVIISLSASVWIQGGGSERDFICTQGPLPNTTADFWRMVWEQNVRIIVMVTALRHKNTVSCFCDAV